MQPKRIKCPSQSQEHWRGKSAQSRASNNGCQNVVSVIICRIEYLFWPAHDREWPESRREPSIENVFILLQCEFGARSEGSCSLCSFFNITAHNPVLAIRVLKRQSKLPGCDNHEFPIHLVPSPQNGRSMRGIDVPTKVDGKYTNPECLLTTDTIRSPSSLERYAIHQLAYAIDTRQKLGCTVDNISTLIASSARGLQSTHHWGFRMGSITSPDLLRLISLNPQESL